MANILFTHSYFYRFDPKQWENHQPYPPLATIQAASLMREEGHEVSLFDTNLIEYPLLIESKLAEVKPEFLVIYDDGFNYLTKMCLTKMREAAFEMIAIARKNGIPVIVNSSDSTDHFEEYLSKGASYVILGEGEETLSELIKNLVDQSDVQDLKGLVFHKNGKTQRNPSRPVMTNLDQLPLPAWDLVEMNDYRKIWLKHHGYFSLNLATTRGCPFKCNWCAKPIYGNRYNSRSPQKVVDEIEMLIEKYGVNHFWFCDDIFGLKPGWVTIFEEEVIKRKLNFSYKIQSRVDLLLKEDNITSLARSGADEIWVGAESGSQKILDAMDKGTQVEQIYEASKLLKSKGIKICFFLQFGYPGENSEDINKTIEMVLDLMPDDIGISVSYPLPGTKFYDMVKSELKVKSNWTDSDDLDLMFKNTFNSEYYKKLHRYLHKKYRRKQGLINLRSIFKNKATVNLGKLRSIFLAALYYTPALVLDQYQLKNLEKR